MRTNERSHQTRNVAVSTLAVLALTFGTALAALVPSTTAYHFSSHPMISGAVVTVNDHQVVVDTDQGEQVTLEVDSRTMAPRDLGPGMVMRAEFVALEDCRLYAQRIVPIRGGMPTNRLQAYANTRDSRETLAGGAPLDGNRQVSVETRESTPQMMGEHSPGVILTAIPTTADYQFSTAPMISGRVISVNDHRLVVETVQGQRVALVMDSRTMVPGTVEPGTDFRAEFTPMKDGRYYAKRISPIGSGVAAREQAYAHTHDSDLLLARNVSDCGYVSAATGNTTTSSYVEPRGTITREPVATQPVAESDAVLPQTASHQPLLLLLGLLAVGAAGFMTVARGVRLV